MNTTLSASQATDLARVAIEQVTPELDGGRHAVKRQLGDVIRVTAVIFKDGHDLISARVLYKGPLPDEPWQAAPLRYDYDSDRWSGEFTVDRPGVWSYTIEAWPDHFRSWTEDLKKRAQAGQDLRSELLEGASLLEATARLHTGNRAERLLTSARRLRDTGAPFPERVAVALKGELLEDAHGPLRPGDATLYHRLLPLVVERDLACFGAWYELFPRSLGRPAGTHGTFRDVEDRLADLAALGFDVLYLPPIHPIGVTHRKGKNNSPVCEPDDVGCPWAIGSAEGGHTAVHPELGTLDDFDSLAATARDFGIEIALDIAFQCSPDHPWIKEHPEWFFVRPDGSLRYAENPPKKYEDIYPLNYWCENREALWQACLEVFLFWIGHGVTVFRVDNPHTKPLTFWEWVIGEVRRRHPETVFLSESFTRPNRMNFLAKIGFSQSYTYFTWKNTAAELRELLHTLTTTNMVEYYRPNFFANTPDILHEYLQQGGRAAFRVRLLLAATLAPSYGIYGGFELCENVPLRQGSEEYLDSEKYQLKARDFKAPGNIRRDVMRLNSIRREHPALQRLDNLTFLETDSPELLAYWKSAPGDDLIVIVNLDPHAWHETTVHLPIDRLQLAADSDFVVEDLLTGERFTWHGGHNYVRLEPTTRAGHLFRIVRTTP